MANSIDGKFWFDERAARMAVAFFERCLHHNTGKWAGQPFILQPWERQIVRDLFGWKKADGTRKFRTAYIEVPRKNGKTTLGAGIALYMLFADGEPGAQVYSAAADRIQAGLVFREAKAMVEGSPILLGEGAQIYMHSIIVPSTNSFYRVLSKEAAHQQGLNSHGVIFDELHVQPDRELWDVLTTSMGARRQPLLVTITTAGYDRTSICWEQHEYAESLLKGILHDDSYYPVIYAADPEDDWLDEKVWERANPNIDVTISREFLRSEAERARQVPAYQNTFRRYYLNQWTSQESRFMPMEAWDACETPYDEQLLKGQVCYGGLDLASTSDIAAFWLDFPDEGDDQGQRHQILEYYWIPKDNVIDRSRRDKVQYDEWVKEGLIRTTEGNVIDFEVILRDIEQLGDQFNIREIAFDRWGATQVSRRLSDMGFQVVGFGQGMASMAAPTKELLRLTMCGHIKHRAHPVTRWMMDNLTVDTDAAGNVKPNKAKSREKIDGPVAGIMALDRAMRHEDTGRSAYEDHGFMMI